MSPETKRQLRRDFLPSGALQRGLVWVALWLILSGLPDVAEALSR